MPLAVPTFPNLAAHLLAETLRREGQAADVFYATTRMRRTPVIEAFVHSVAGAAIFAPYLTDDPEPDAHAAAVAACLPAAAELRESISRVARDAESHSWPTLPPDRLGIRPEELPDPATLRDAGDDAVLWVTALHIRLAGLCLQDSLRDLPAGCHDIFAFSLTFDSQKVASLALAKLLKQREPSCRIVFGGSACDGPMGEEVLRRFPFVDIVYQGEADQTIGSLVSALRGELPVDGVPGVLYRRGRGLARTVPAPMLSQLDESPIPRYESFLNQLHRSDWRSEEPFILFEASRGCWWGEKHHCVFCGLRADGMAFRRKSRARVLSEVEGLARRYPGHKVLYATDAILDHRETTPLLEGLRDIRNRLPLRLFFEIKSTVSPGQVAGLADAGVATVQPGIESFSDHILQLMDKGATGLRQVQLLKWLDAYGIVVIYNLLLGTPGETAQDYREVIKLIGSLHHLTPPSQVGMLSLDRFSPYFRYPERYGLSGVAPEPAYGLQFLDPSVGLGEIAYRFTFQVAGSPDPELPRAWAQLRQAVATWRSQYPRRGLWIHERPGAADIVERDGGVRRTHTLYGVSADVYRFASECRTFTALARAFPDVAPEALRACLMLWVDRGWMACSVNRRSVETYLSLCLPVPDQLHAEPPRSLALKVPS
jgi:ribosomal peptide maturation radical SAM protein 1